MNGCKNETLRRRKFCPDHRLAGRIPKDPVERFWPKVDKSGTCWLWLAAPYTEENLHGVFNFGNGESNGAHRFSYMIHHGPIPDGYDVNHKCHVKRCVRPDHLDLRDKNDNGAYRKGPALNNKVGIRNVFWWEHKQRWVGRIRYRGKDYSTGCKSTAQQAEAAVIALRRQVFGVDDFDPSLYV